MSGDISYRTLGISAAGLVPCYAGLYCIAFGHLRLAAVCLVLFIASVVAFDLSRRKDAKPHEENRD